MFSDALPSRTVVHQRLEAYFKEIPEARYIERMTLHYIDGRIHVEVLIPFNVLADGNPGPLTRRLREAISQDQEIADLSVHFY